MPKDNSSLDAAKKAKNDEFYTRLVDIENEVWHYEKYFHGKIVYCNCDNPRVSMFWKFFRDQFETLKLKKLIASTYRNPCPDQRRTQEDLLAEQQEIEDAQYPPEIESRPAVWIEYVGKKRWNLSRWRFSQQKTN